MKAFEIGKKYSMRSACNHECIWSYIVVARTAQTITLSDGEQLKKCRISKADSAFCGAETVFPLGRYSMAPTLSADKISE